MHKLSELIEKLQELKDQHGDIDIGVLDEDSWAQGDAQTVPIFFLLEEDESGDIIRATMAGQSAYDDVGE